MIIEWLRFHRRSLAIVLCAVANVAAVWAVFGWRDVLMADKDRMIEDLLVEIVELRNGRKP